MQLSFQTFYKEIFCLRCPCFLFSVSWNIERIATGFDLTDDDSILGDSRAIRHQEPGPLRDCVEHSFLPAWASHLQSILWEGCILI